MPSLAAKSEAVVAVDPAEMPKAIVVMMEKKIRNLEKRKGKLEDYRSKQSGGLTLNDEQLKAVAKLDDVLSQIDLLQELTKQFNAYAADAIKQQKRQQKRDRFEQSENERKRFLSVLHLQSVLNALGVEETRAAFAEGTGGAVKLEEKELNHLDELYKIINPERGAEESLIDPLKAASEHLQSLLDARDRAVTGTTYRELNELVTKIQNCPYFTEKPKSPEAKEVADNTDAATEDGYVHINADEVPCADSAEVQSSLPPEVLPEQPDVTSSSEQNFEQSAMAHQPVANQPKSIEKIVETVQGQFNFLQESVLEMDSAHADPAVLAVHPMPTQSYQQQQPMINHSQHQPENSYLGMAQGGEDVPPQLNPSQMKNVPDEASPQSSNRSVFSSQPEHNFDTGMTFESSTFKQHDKPATGDDYHQRNQGPMRRGGGGYRGGRGNHSNGFNGGRGGGGGYRGPSDRSGGGYRSDKPSGDRGRQHSPSNNGFHSDQRRGGRGGPRGGSGGYRGGSGRGNRGGNRGGFRGGHQQQQHQQQQH